LAWCIKTINISIKAVWYYNYHQLYSSEIELDCLPQWTNKLH